MALPPLMLLVRLGLPVSFSKRPLLILFMPGLLSVAMLGGLRPGLLSTAISALLQLYFLIPPRNQFASVASMNDFVSKPVDPEVLYATLLKWLLGGDALPE